MKKYYFTDGHTVKCENLPADEIKKLEQEHGLLVKVKISGLGCIKCKYGYLKDDRGSGATNCTQCVLDGTDACPRGAGRDINSTICENFLKEKVI